MDAASKKPATKKAAKKTQVGFEESLWDAANKLRGSVESAEYKHIVLSLIFLKFISDKFEVRKKAIVAEYGDEYIDMVDFYAMDNVFYLPEDARWSTIQINAKQGDIAVKIDTALHAVEKNNKSLAGALPDNYFSRLGLDASKLSALIDTINNIDTIANQNEKTEEDLVGRVYEYFLGKFAASEGKGGGEFYTPKSIVTLIADMIEPFEGKIYDPCCGSGGMFVQSLKFINSHNGNQKNISIYGQEYTNTTYKLAKMNLAVRGISGNLGDVAGDTFFKDQHPDLKADYIAKVEKIKLPNTKIKILQQMLAKAIGELKKVNQTQGIDFTKRFESLVQRYNERKEDDVLVSSVLDDFSESMVDMIYSVRDEMNAGDELGIDIEEKGFYDALKMLAIKYDFDYPEDKLIELAQAVKVIVDDKVKFVDWNHRDDIKSSLKVELILILAKFKYPPISHDEVYKEIFDQAQSFKINRVKDN